MSSINKYNSKSRSINNRAVGMPDTKRGKKTNEEGKINISGFIMFVMDALQATSLF